MSKATGIKGYTPDHLRRKEDAEKRQAAHSARSAEEQLALLDERPGKALRERERLS
jgi:hypothetical protein